MNKIKKRLETELWELCKIYIRSRDKDTCQKCGKKVYGRGADTSHVLCKNRYKSLKYDENNLKVFCMWCHKWWHNVPTESGEWFKNKFPERWEYLQEKKKIIRKIGEVELQEHIDEYLDKIAGIELTKGEE